MGLLATGERIPIHIVYDHPVFGTSIVMVDEKPGILETGVVDYFRGWPPASPPTLGEAAAYFARMFRADLTIVMRNEIRCPA